MKLKLKLNSAYLCVKNMNRALKFYEQLLNKEVDVRDEIFSIFKLESFRLCLFNPVKVNEMVKYGDNCLLSFETNDIDLLMKHLKKLKVKIVYPLTRIGNSLVLEFKDTEGNDIEAYSKIRKN